MNAATLNLTVHRGITLGPITFVFKDEDGAVVDLTGYTAHAEARKRLSGPVVIDFEPTVSDATAGEVTIYRTDELTNAYAAGLYRWDLVLENASGERLGPFLAGEVTVATLNTQP